MLALLLFAAAVHHVETKPATTEGRLALIEARQMLEAQQIWSIKADLPPEVIKALSDVELHVQHDIEQEDKIRDLTATVAALQARLSTIEMLLQDKTAIDSATRIPVAPMQVQPLEVPARPSPRKAPKKKPRKPRVAESP